MIRVLGAALAAVGLLAAPAAAQVAPDARWETAETAHLRVTYPAGLDSLARRAAVAGERAWSELAARLEEPAAPVEVLLTDDVDVANGYAVVTPYPAVVLYAHPPYDDLSLLDYDDWLDVLLAHELTHVFQLDRVAGPGRLLRAVFGRVPDTWPIVPGVATPRWTVEGPAVRAESALTGRGRLNGTAAERVVATAAAEGAFPSLGFVTGDPAAWPAGETAYLFGGEFAAWLARRGGPGAWDRWIDALDDDWIPFRLGAAARQAFGTDLDAAWGAWRDEVEARARDRAAALRPGPPATVLVPPDRYALHPRFSPDGSRLAVARYDGRSDVALEVVDPATGAALSRTRVPRLGVAAWRADGSLVIGGYRWRGPYRPLDDLWVARPGARAEPWTDGARLAEPDVGPDGTVVAVQGAGGTDRLVVLRGADPVPVAPFDPAVQWAWPRWSPDGSRIAVTRLRAGRRDVVVLDRSGRVTATVEGPGLERAQNLSPAWSPDGRWVVFSSDRTGTAQLYAWDARGEAGLRQVTGVVGGAVFPDVSPDGRWIAYAAYHHAGWGIERIPFDPAAWRDPAPAGGRGVGPVPWPAGRPVAPADSVAWAPRPYAPWRTLRPHWWVPRLVAGETVRGRDVIGAGVGVETSAADLVGRHAIDLSATVDVEHGWVDGLARYANAALGVPVLSGAFSQSWDFAGFALAAPAGGGVPDTLLVLERDQTLSMAATVPIRHPWRSVVLSGGAGVVRERRRLFEGDHAPGGPIRLADPTSTLPLAFASAAVSTARLFPLAVSPAAGVSAAGRVERRFDPAGDGRRRWEATGRVAAYRALGRPWGFAPTVLALRASGGAAGGPGAGAGHFALGGASGEGLASTGIELVASRRWLFPLRGYDRGERRGTRAWSATAEVRFPLAFPQAGRGTLPAFLGSVWGDVFADAGDAWDPCDPGGRECPADAGPLASVGAELAADLTLGYQVPITLRVGVGRALVEPVGTRAWVRLGRSF